MEIPPTALFGERVRYERLGRANRRRLRNVTTCPDSSGIRSASDALRGLLDGIPIPSASILVQKWPSRPECICLKWPAVVVLAKMIILK